MQMYKYLRTCLGVSKSRIGDIKVIDLGKAGVVHCEGDFLRFSTPIFSSSLKFVELSFLKSAMKPKCLVSLKALMHLSSQ